VLTAGIDIGSRTVKLAVLEGGRLVHYRVEYNSHDPLDICRELLKGLDTKTLTATGYGRRLFSQYWDCAVITEIRAASIGSRYFLPSCRTILDIGGQDTKVISMDEAGKVLKFEMNDKCAAGTGRFLEVMAAALSYSMQDFITAANTASKSQKINSMCTVFAESEVVSMVARGLARDELAMGIHQAIGARAASMLNRVPLEDDVMFCGGVAINTCLKQCVEAHTGKSLKIPDHPQIVAAVGCALVSGMELNRG
jgi:(R)-2-hydroxyacyl-CoA dehydratese activating ATPase